MPPSYEIDTAGPVYGCLIHVSFLDLKDPKVTRLLSINSDKPFSDLHAGIQAALQWGNKSPYGFSRIRMNEAPQSTDGSSSAHDEDVVSISKDSNLSTIFDEMDPDKRVVAYKYGTNWVLTVKLITRMAVTGRLFCMSGRGHPPAESTTPTQWMQFVRAYEKAKTKKDKDSARKPFDKGVKFADGSAGSIAGPWNWNKGAAIVEMDKTSSSSVEDEARPSANTAPYPKVGKLAYPQNPKGNYVVAVFLECIDCPSISRFLSCPAELTFEDFEKAIQTVFEWAGIHMGDFDIRDSDTNMGPSLIQISRDPLDVSKEGEENETILVKSKDIVLEEVFDNPKYKGRVMFYEYDFGDSWEHGINVLGRSDVATNQVVCFEGEGHRCAEDCGAISGWEELQELYFFNKGDKETRTWYQTSCMNGDLAGLGGDRLWRWDQDEVNEQLSLSQRRYAVPTRVGRA
ncbi:MAG: hypothetical protein M1812_002390 [Candelaria pacifica]|nr:MAG: hypothetical protein M1812_002390 [Candelaria pacifica]